MSELRTGLTRRGLSKRARTGVAMLALGAGLATACSQAEATDGSRVTGSVEAPNCTDAPRPTQRLSSDKVAEGLMKERTQQLQVAICEVAYSTADAAIRAYQTNSPELRLIRNEGPNHNYKGFYFIHVAARQGGNSVNMNFATKASGEPDLSNLESVSIFSPHINEQGQPVAGMQDEVVMRYNSQLGGWSLTDRAIAYSDSQDVLSQPRPEFNYYPYAYGLSLAEAEAEAQHVEQILDSKTAVQF